MARRLPTREEASAILAAKRSRPALRPPPPAGRALAGFLKGLDARFGDAAAGPRVLKARWSEIVGEVLARRTEPVRLIRARGAAGAAGGGLTLEVRVDGPAAALVQHQAPDVLARVNLALGAGAVERLRIVQGPVARPAQAVPGAGPGRRGRGPLDAAAEAELAAGLAQAPDGPLKAALLRLGREVARRG